MTADDDDDTYVPRYQVDKITVKPGQLAKMAASGAVPSPELRAAIERARQRRHG
ncbi:hypothetical protein [Nocardia xishanensis]|uniref:hypothetical protein n=1 Tax=Nocardia xishanensis TaxID=238964 RepID=UPI000AE67250|nr:hypothetical protein [Nocardia xishanensis]